MFVIIGVVLVLIAIQFMKSEKKVKEVTPEGQKPVRSLNSVQFVRGTQERDSYGAWCPYGEVEVAKATKDGFTLLAFRSTLPERKEKTVAQESVVQA